MARSATPLDTLSIERLGKVHTWTLYKKPVNGPVSEQDAYARGFRAYVADFNMGIDRPVTVNYRKATDQAAYALGYNDARTGGVITDGRPTTQAESDDLARTHSAAAGARAGTNQRAQRRAAARTARDNATGGAAARARKRPAR